MGMLPRSRPRWPAVFDALAAPPAVVVAPSQHRDGPALHARGVEIAHIHADGTVDIRLTRREISARRAMLADNPYIRLRAGTSDWIGIDVTRPEGAKLAIACGRVAIARAAG